MSEYPVSLSPKIIDHLIDNLDLEITDREGAIRWMCEEIVTNASIFCNRFEESYFLREEPIHEFIAIQFRNDDTSLVEEELRCRLVLHKTSNEVNVYLTSEIPIDEDYDVHHVIAESKLPEFWEDKQPAHD